MGLNLKLHAAPIILLLTFLSSPAHADKGWSCGRDMVPREERGPPTITVIAGTDRPGSNTSKIAKIAVAKLLSQGVLVHLVDLSELPAETFKPFQKKMMETDGFVWVVPEYNGSFPGALKYFIDLLKFPETLDEMPSTFIGLSAGQAGASRALDQLSPIIQYRDGNIFSKKTMIPGVDSKISADGTTITDEYTQKKFNQQLEGFQKFIDP